MFFVRQAKSDAAPEIDDAPKPEAPAALARPRQQIYLGGFRALTSLFSGHKIFVDTRDVGIAAHLLWEGRWEPWIDHHVLDAIKDGMTVCDVGASFGYYTLLMADRVGARGRVYAFEPNPGVATLLRQSVAVNGFSSRVEVQAIALGDKEEQLFLHVDPAFQGGAFLDSFAEAKGLVTTAVPVRRLDEFLPPDIAIDFLKVDVEGFEDAVMAGAGAVLHNPALKGALLEFRRDSEEIGSLPSYIKALFGRGMTAMVLEPDGPHPLPDLEAVLAIPRGHLTNILFRAPENCASPAP
ncbi:FkbM family methyltransferase [Roseococcus pinisoli]|uniref:FkbM family methyltransferase n=1 Tax=Roseococcus pinisoli TaxID=2835040 RepID=A0ABS5QL10_9PROT|nr:FkbM family methyltransferase [Roseococcus pinisoli]MBS7813378.1 FkbM family methyltransferase [Roseococcus pinisoli]